jgi:precorrin-6B methylase 2
MARHAEAALACQRVLAISPGDFESLWMLGNCRMSLGDPRAAEQLLRSAIAVDAQRAIAWKDLGAALNAQDRRQEAIDASSTAVRLDAAQGVRSDSFVNLAIELADDGRLADALTLLEQMLPDLPYVHGHVAYAQSLLKAARLKEGWEQYEFRFLCEPCLSTRQELGRPSWSGQDLHGKIVLLLAEQGLGDTIQFIRYAPRLQALGAKVLLRAPVGFEDFASSFPGVDRVLGHDEKPADFDYWISMVSLPHGFEIDAHNVPASVPYLYADPERQARWAPRLRSAHGLAVGLAWAGNPNHASDRHRSLPLSALAPLGEVAGARFFALQKGARELEAETPPDGMAVENLGPELHDFRDTAAAISQLDLVICVDTAVAHLAGAMGKTVWMLLARNAEWRWLEKRVDSDWYPTMRLFRQRRDGDWGEVIERVRMALRDLARSAGNPLSAPAKPQRAPGSGEADCFRPGEGTTERPRSRAGWSAVAHTRVGALQYLPAEPLEGVSLSLYGEILQPQLDLIATLMLPGGALLEVGSGIGAHAIPLAQLLGPDGRLLLCESRRPHQQILQQNLVAHGVGNVALMAMGGGEAVDALDLKRLDLLKVNAGATLMTVLAGAQAALWRLRPSLFLAVADASALDRGAATLKDFGYRCWHVATPLFNHGNFNRRTEDVFRGAMALSLVGIPEESQRSVTQMGCVEI